MADLGVYIHIPFCASRCDYCAFATWTDRGHLIDEYLEAVRADIVATAIEVRAISARTAAA